MRENDNHLLNLTFRDGAMMRSNPLKKWNPPITESRRRQGQRSAPVAILSKFRKDERKLSNYFILDDNIMFFVQYFI